MNGHIPPGRRTSEEGTTLVEVSVALLLAAIVVAAAYGAYQLAAAAVASYGRHTETERALFLAQRRLAADLRTSMGVVAHADTAWSVLMASPGASVRYGSGPDGIRRNGVPFALPQGVLRLSIDTSEAPHYRAEFRAASDGRGARAVVSVRARQANVAVWRKREGEATTTYADAH